MDFGIVLPLFGRNVNWNMILQIAREAERLGYDSLWVSDHLISPGGSPYTIEPWTVLSALASVTRKVRLGTYVICNQFRHPSIVAKMASTLDHISEGRVDLGLGAGWLRSEHIAFGFPWDKHESRVERLRESIEIIKKLWIGNSVSYASKFFQIKNANLQPKPIQNPHPPLWVGGNSGAIMQIVAELGDGWIPVLPTPRQIADGISYIRKIMKQVRREPEKLQIAYGGSGCALIAENEELVKKMAEPLVRSMGKSIEKSPCIIGTPVQCRRKIEHYQKAGAQKIVAGFYDFPSLSGMQLFASSVMPHFKQ